ncbi:unnamed protein product [Amoebophrya sp. A120]|nr:unnamed protein product [Amoebophrya sp. A120]|eukprot:GSA120T00018345001.1
MPSASPACAPALCRHAAQHQQGRRLCQLHGCGSSSSRCHVFALRTNPVVKTFLPTCGARSCRSFSSSSSAMDNIGGTSLSDEQDAAGAGVVPAGTEDNKPPGTAENSNDTNLAENNDSKPKPPKKSVVFPRATAAAADGDRSGITNYYRAKDKADDLLNQRVMAMVAAVPARSSGSLSEVVFQPRRNVNRHTLYRITQLRRTKRYLLARLKEVEEQHVEKISSTQAVEGDVDDEGGGVVVEQRDREVEIKSEKDESEKSGDHGGVAQRGDDNDNLHLLDDLSAQTSESDAAAASEGEKWSQPQAEVLLPTASKNGPSSAGRPSLINITPEEIQERLLEVETELRLLGVEDGDVEVGADEGGRRHGIDVEMNHNEDDHSIDDASHDDHTRSYPPTAERYLQERLTALAGEQQCKSLLHGRKSSSAKSKNNSKSLWSRVRDYSRLPMIMTNRRCDRDAFVLLDKQREETVIDDEHVDQVGGSGAAVGAITGSSADEERREDNTEKTTASATSHTSTSLLERRLHTLYTMSNSHGISWDELDEEYLRWAHEGQSRAHQWNKLVWPPALNYSSDSAVTAAREAQKEAKNEKNLEEDVFSTQLDIPTASTRTPVSSGLNNATGPDHGEDSEVDSLEEDRRHDCFSATKTASGSTLNENKPKRKKIDYTPRIRSMEEELLSQVRYAAWWRATKVIEARIRERKKREESYEITEMQKQAMVSGLRRATLHRWKQLYLKWYRPGQLVRHLREIVLLRQNERELAERVGAANNRRRRSAQVA